METSVVIVTGASQGIGKATALKLAGTFGAIVLVARDEDGLQETAAAIKAQGKQTLTIAADLRLPQAAEQIVQATLAQFGRIDALVNVAGAVPQIDLFEMTDEQWNDGAELKLHGARRLAIKAWEALKAAKGAVVFISGTSAFTPKPTFAAVATINAAIIALAKAFADQGIKDGVQVNSVSPGPVMTGRRKSFLTKWSQANGVSMEAAAGKFLEEAHISRYGEPEDVAELIAFLVSPPARWMTGNALRIDGGEVKGI
ncbi:SDR family oxidoreductase [Chitinophaga agrisoli]|uniref:SDR family oxidoreductase n=1 Tax=Chitinophaga agrisoli TaxID=2607653 RepID=A0A5B2VYL5_9BACT|nr:SDR family oxidoreductase [Chitinophaga agrisoli]KAA2243277.1 SDR family oxidoreductase [Chitinophaga agrisoli]